jgi:hypothetical protein
MVIISFIVHGMRSIKLEEIAILSKRVIEIPGKNSQIHNGAQYGYNGKGMLFTLNHCRCKPKNYHCGNDLIGEIKKVPLVFYLLSPVFPNQNEIQESCWQKLIH